MSVLLAKLSQVQRRRTAEVARRQKTVTEWPVIGTGGEVAAVEALYDLYETRTEGGYFYFKVRGVTDGDSKYAFSFDGDWVVPSGLDTELNAGGSSIVYLNVVPGEASVTATITVEQGPGGAGTGVRFPLWYICMESGGVKRLVDLRHSLAESRL